MIKRSEVWTVRYSVPGQSSVVPAFFDSGAVVALTLFRDQRAEPAPDMTTVRRRGTRTSRDCCCYATPPWWP